MKARILVWVTLFAAMAANGAGLIVVEDTRWWPGPVPPPRHPIQPIWPRPVPPEPMPPRFIFAPLETTELKVDTRIKDQVATTTVDQLFSNPHGTRVEGTFLFPLPKGAQIDKFTMEMDGKQVEAELLPADKARKIYEDITRKLKDPALLEYADRDLFKAKIFPIEPHGTKRVTISYTQVLKADSGLIAYNLPLSAGKFSAKPAKSVSVKVNLETRKPLKSIYSPSHKVEVKREGQYKAVAGYEATDSDPADDFTLYYAPEKDEIGVNLLTSRVPGEDGYFLLLASPGIESSSSRVIPKDVVFVLDTSGSMAGQKLEQAKKALLFCVDSLNDNDRFEIIRFATDVDQLFDKTVTASPENRTKANDFIRGLKPLGGTAIDDALQKAFSLAPSRDSSDGRVFVIIFLTDGRPTVGVTREEDILDHAKKRNSAGIRIFTFGIGTDVNTHLLDKLSEDARGFTQYVLPEEDLELKLSSFFSKIKQPVLASPVLKFTGDLRISKTYPSPLPDLFQGEQVVLVGRYSGNGDAAIVLEGTVDGATRKFTYEASWDSAETHSFIPRLWATRRVGFLLDEIRLRGENAELRDEVVELARKFGIVTPYTAYLIVEDEDRRQIPASSRSIQNFEKDQEARDEAARSWSQFKTEKAGDAAVADALVGQELRMAEAAAPAAARGSAAFQRRYGIVRSGTGGVSQSAPVVAGRLAQYSQQSQFAGGKTFFQSGTQWIDSAVQSNLNRERVRIQFASNEYFDLATQHPETSQWLALGATVQFLMGNRIYEVYE